MPVALPGAALAERLLEHVQGERLDQPGLLGERDELVRSDQAARRVVPAQQRLDRLDRAARRAPPWAGSRGRSSCSLDRAAQLADQRQPRRVGLAAGVVVERRIRPSPPWREYIATSAWRSSVSTSSPCVGNIAMPIEPSAGQGQAVDDHRLLERGADLLDHDDRVALAARLGDQHPELVAAEAGHRVRAAQGGAQPPADLHQQRVAGVVAERVVDVLEAVEVHHGHGELAALALGDRDGLLDPVAEQGAVGQVGQASCSA